MSRVYDNWETLVDAILKKDLYRQLALAPSFDSTVSESTIFSEDFSSRLSFDYPAYDLEGLFRAGVWTGGIGKQILSNPILLADRVIKVAAAAYSSKQLCSDLKSKSEELAGLLCQAARSTNDLPYERPTSRIIANTEQVLEKALAIVLKCQGNRVVRRMFAAIPTAVFRQMSAQLESSIGDVSWLLRISAGDRRGEYLGIPPIAANEPVLCIVWQNVSILFTGLPDDRSAAAASLVSLAHENDRYGKLIIEEGAVGPLLKLLKEGKEDGQEHAARAIGLLGKHLESVDHMVETRVCSAFLKILEEGPIKVQPVVAWATSELVAHHPECQYLFTRHNIVRLLIGRLVVETVQEHSKFSVAETRDYMKEMAARALWQLARGNSSICRSITESRALLCFAILLEKGPERAQYNSAMALMEISAVAEEDVELRRSAFKPNSPACKAVVDQLFRVIEKADSELLVPCVKTIGNLARTFRVTETRMIGPLVKLLDEERDIEVIKEACVALTKFAHSYNYLHIDHSKAIIDAGGAKHLVQLVYFGEQMLQNSALVLLSYIALHVPDSEELARAEVLTVLEWASKQAPLVQDEEVEKLLTEKLLTEKLLTEAIGKLEQYHSRRLY